MSATEAGVFHSTDGGLTWENLIHSEIPHGFDNMVAVDFVNSQTGWVIGNAPNFILKTTDGGQSWFEQSGGGGLNLTFVDDQYGWIVGSGGTILHTTNGGQTWLPQNSGTGFKLQAVSFIDRHHGWVAGEAFTGNGFEGIILHTGNGGQTWIDQTPGTQSSLSDVSFVDSLHGWVVGGRRQRPGNRDYSAHYRWRANLDCPAAGLGVRIRCGRLCGYPLWLGSRV
ncbi:MAG: hypothetical protein GWN00_02165 [Aliifodinibius sp.]|nr:hypothetical protein [candidate division Zixibacteria bacterium]NIT55078.1 hypothetical protein [Fodinibius sp.]NIW43458.1 hypothetical protein [Gammaproteobacteria bacterium]NIS44624.1 hypothetical protein [candidate division Zixibacteria bacterium]NIU12678.1 hypothetical protein [candidate division Zixibacteria bacterium]